VLNEDAVLQMDGSKLLAIEVTSALVASPLIVWLALYLAARWWSLGLRPVLPWLRVLRWVGWGLGIALYLTYFARDRFPWVYGAAMLSFSIGLLLPEGWVKRRFAPDLMEPDSPDGWWPSKRE
jgi:hypothetical protein